MEYRLLDFLGLNIWVSKQSLLPFEFKELYLNPSCIAILTLDHRMLSTNSYYTQIKNLYSKMLAVLELSVSNLLEAIMYYEVQTFSTLEQRSLTLKLLDFAPNMILTFGNINFLDQDLLKSKNVMFKNILHPAHLLNNLQDKKIAYADLLACKQQLNVRSND